MEYNHFMNKLQIFFTILCDRELLTKSLKIAIIVGTILNIINQSEAIFSLDFHSIDYVKSLLTYMVPFLVSTYTAISMKMKFKIGELTQVDANLECNNCKKNLKVYKNERIPICSNCNEQTQWRIK